MKAIAGLNETINLVFDFLQDSKVIILTLLDIFDIIG